MRTLTATLTAAQKAANRVPKFRLTFSKAGEDNVVVEQDRILYPSGEETPNSQKATFVFQNSGGYFTALDLKGWGVVIERGLLNAAGTVEYDSMPPMKVISQRLDSRPGNLHCTMAFIGIPDLLTMDKASKDYYNHWSNAKTVKALITEIADGNAVDTELTEEQTTTDSVHVISSASEDTVVGAALTVPNRTITKLSFRLWKNGTPGGNVTFKISQDAGGSILGSKTLATSSIGYVAAWKEVTFDAPVVVNERVWLTVEYTAGDASNYVIVDINTVALKPDEALVCDGLPGASASPDDTWEDAGQACAYRYKYTGGTGDTNGVDCFEHCTAYEVTYDSEDSLIDTYVPADGFKIGEGQTRLGVIDTLLKFTGCVRTFKADGKIHVFVPTTTGTTYAYQYQLGAGNHEFFAKSIRNALVLPNKITVHSYPSDDIQYSGSSTDSASYALLPKDDFIRATLTSDAQAVSIAVAMIARAQMNGQRGSATVPINLGAEIYDYVKVTDSRENDNRVGNLGYIQWSYIPGKEYNMTFSFGKHVQSPIRTPSSRPEFDRPITVQELADYQYLVNDEVIDGEYGLKAIWAKLGLKADDSETTTEIADVITGYIKSLVEDVTPQLGGDLALNGKNIDFPTTANISDCLDEDNMASNSATKLATQQSIKAYVDAKGKTATVDATTLTKDTVYQNTSGYPLLVVVWWSAAANGMGYMQCDASNPPVAVVGNVCGATVAMDAPIVWVVANNYYYKSYSGGTATISGSVRIQLGQH